MDEKEMKQINFKLPNEKNQLIEKVNLIDYFNIVGYNWEKDKEEIATICKLTKTRVNPTIKEFIFSPGQEQTFFLKALAEKINAKNFFEVGTGRGTACYALSLNEDMEEITTIDIVPHDQKKNEAIEYKHAFVSNADLYEMVPYEEKRKISFKQRADIFKILSEKKGYFDLCFIDGNHSDPRIIEEDFRFCCELIKDDGVIVFDDYHPEKFVVKHVVDRILKKEDWHSYLILLTGHLFASENQSKDFGMVVMSKKEL
jgi:predicted O-methyltransferase YrrM